MAGSDKAERKMEEEGGANSQSVIDGWQRYVEGK
jgi:hypothetical protein